MDAKVKGEPGILMMKPDMIKACCDAAHKHNLPVAAHVQSPDGVRAAVRNGVRIFTDLAISISVNIKSNVLYFECKGTEKYSYIKIRKYKKTK